MYLVKDLQFEDKYFAGGEIFKSKKNICETLIEYHSIDCDMSIEQKLFDNKEIGKCLNALEDFGWRIERLNKKDIK